MPVVDIFDSQRRSCDTVYRILASDTLLLDFFHAVQAVGQQRCAVVGKHRAFIYKTAVGSALQTKKCRSDKRQPVVAEHQRVCHGSLPHSLVLSG